MNTTREEQPSVNRSLETVPASRYLLFALIALGGGGLDLWTKHLVFQLQGMPGEKPVWWFWEGFVGIETSLNTGALFGLGADRVTWLAAISTFALAGVVAWFVIGKLGRSLPLTIVLGFVTAGIIGNLYDRLGLWSVDETGVVQVRAVRDWIRFSYGDWVWPNFNLADSYLVCSAISLMVFSFLAPEASAENHTANGLRAEKSTE